MPITSVQPTMRLNNPSHSRLHRVVAVDDAANDLQLRVYSTGIQVTGTIQASGAVTGSNLSGTNTGDETTATIKTKLGFATGAADGYLKATDWTTFNNKQSALGYTAEDTANKDTDVTLAANSDTKYPSQKAIKAYVVAGLATKQNSLGYTAENQANRVTTISGADDSHYPTALAVKTFAESLVVGLLDDRGNYDASGNTWPASGGSGSSGAILKGDLWYISVAGTLGGVAVAVGSSIRALVDNPGQTAANWDVLNVGLGYTPENSANKATSTSLGTSDTLYPSQNAVKVYVDTGLATKQNSLGYTPVNKAGDTMSGALTLTLTALGTTQTDGMALVNGTNAVVGTVLQISPAFRWQANGLETTGNTSQTYAFRADVLPLSQATSIDAIWRLRSSFNGAAYVDRFAVKTEGNDTKLQVGGVNFFGKAGNQNDFFAGSTSLRFLSNTGGSVFATMNNSIGTWTLATGTVSGSATTPALSITQTWNTTGVAKAIFLNVTQVAVGSNARLIDLQVNSASKFAIWTNTGGSETFLAVNDNKVFGQGSGRSQFYAASKITFYNQAGDTGYFEMDASGYIKSSNDGSAISYTASGVHRLNILGNGAKISTLVFSAHTTPEPYYETRSSRGTDTSPTATQSGDVLGGLVMSGRGATGWNSRGAAITAVATQNFTDANGGTALKFETTAANTVSSVVRQIITAAGLIVIGATEANTVPALKAASAVLEARLGDDSDYADFTAGRLKTKQPSAGGAGLWKLGKVTSGAALTLVTNSYVEVDIDGVVVKLAQVA